MSCLDFEILRGEKGPSSICSQGFAGDAIGQSLEGMYGVGGVELNRIFNGVSTLFKLKQEKKTRW